MLSTISILFFAWLLDWFMGEVKRFHPLVGFGLIAKKIEHFFNCQHHAQKKFSSSYFNWLGAVAWLVLVVPVPILYFMFYQSSLLFDMIDIVIIYFALALHSLRKHALNVYFPLKQNNLVAARQSVQMMVSRETSELDETAISRATVESVLENGHDAVIATLFWYLIGGAPLVIVHRLANTLDAMWGYKNQRFINFGWFAAKADDWLGWPSAKLTGLLYVLSRQWRLLEIKTRIQTAYLQSADYKSLNGGWVMSLGASALNIQLGGVASYHGKTFSSVALGKGDLPTVDDIQKAINLITHASLLFLFVLLALQGVYSILFLWSQ